MKMIELEENADSETSESSEDENVVEELEEEKEEEEHLSSKRLHEDPVEPDHVTKKLKHNELYKPPTVDELNNLKEAEALFHSSLFRLQIDELMSEVKIKPSSELQTWVNSLKSYLKSLPSSDVYHVDDLSWLKNEVKIPIQCHHENKKAFFRFMPPLDVYEIGSYALDVMYSTEPVIDLALEMPSACFRKADYLNQIYHRKRALYLAYIAQSLKNQDICEGLEYAYQNGCPLKPTLLIKSKKLGEMNFSVRLLPYPELRTFKIQRFHPENNNVRASWFYDNDNTEEQNHPTPFYNSSILADLMIPKLTEYLKEKISSQSVKDAVILAKVWSAQRGLLNGATSFSGFLILIIISYLLVKRKVSPMMSSYQIFRNFILFLKSENIVEQGITLCTEQVENQPALSTFHEMFEIVLVDPSGFVNLCYNMCKASFKMMQHEASIALKILDDTPGDSFFLLFINKVPFCRKFEYLIHLKDVKKFSEYADLLGLKHAVLDHGGDLVPAVVPRLCKLLEEGLGDRLLLIDFDAPLSKHWPVTRRFLHPNLSRQVTLGLLVNQEFAFSNLEKGPAADDPKAREFREFWGEKSELRRFKDGSIHEAVVWPAETAEDQRRVLPLMVKYILEKHAGIRESDIVCRGTDINFSLSLPKHVLPASAESESTGEEMFTALMQSFNSFTKQLRTVDGLPLAVASVQGTSSAFRFCDVFPPISRSHPFRKPFLAAAEGVMIPKIAKRCPDWVPPLQVVVHFEGSGKWPDDKEAIKRVKTAMLLKIAQLLNSQFGLICKPTTSHVDVLKDNYVFRLEVACHKEITLLKQVITSEGMVKIKDNKVSQHLEYRTEILPKLNSILHGIHQQHNTFGTACRLAKRLISSQLLHGYIQDILIELIMASVYIKPEPFTCPSSPQVAFQRFLALVHSHNWDLSPLVVNLNNELKQQDLEEIQSAFSSQRSTLPPMVVITPFDKSGTLLTRESPSPMIFKRLIVVCRAALEFLEKKLCQPDSSEFEELFKPPLHPYDVLIHLNHRQIPRYCFALKKEKQDGVVKKTEKMEQNDGDCQKMPVVGFDPVEHYLQELRDVFGDLALFFYDIYGGTYIAVLWNREAFKPKPFKVSHINCHKISTSGVNQDGTMNIVPNLEAILTDFSEIGLGLVESIEKRIGQWDL